jgi:hypothetical protein
MSTPFDDVLAAFRLGESETFLRLDGVEDFNRATKALLQQARREVYILTPDFEPERYNNMEFRDALSAFMRTSRYTDTRILLGDPTIAVRWGHKVVSLAKRMTSKLQIRQLSEEDFQSLRNEAWIVADDICLLRRDGMDGYQGSLAARAIPHAQRASQRFLELWERAGDIPDFRTLNI